MSEIIAAIVAAFSGICIYVLKSGSINRAQLPFVWALIIIASVCTCVFLFEQTFHVRALLGLPQFPDWWPYSLEETFAALVLDVVVLSVNGCAWATTLCRPDGMSESELASRKLRLSIRLLIFNAALLAAFAVYLLKFH